MVLTANMRGIACMVVAAGTFVANDTCMKLALADLPPLEVLVMRGLAAGLWCLPTLLFFGYGRHLASILNPWVLLRCLCEFVAIMSFIFALNYIPIADVTAIVQIAPLLVLVGVALIWKERIGPLRWLLISFGIVGALMVAQPGAPTASPFAVLGFATALGSAARDIVSRKVPPGIPGLVVAFATIMVVLIGAGAAMLVFESTIRPAPYHAGLMAIAGFFLMCGHLFIFLAFRYAPARVVAPFNYAFTLWAVLSGLVVFGDVPNTLAVAGMGLIVLSGLAVILLEGRTRQGPVVSPV